LSTLVDNPDFLANPSFTISLDIRVPPPKKEKKGLTRQLKTSGYDDAVKKSKSHTDKVVFSLAKMLHDPSGGNIEFLFPPKDGRVDSHTPRLYAFSHVIESSLNFQHFCTPPSNRMS
jgi:hypothetical protein